MSEEEKQQPQEAPAPAPVKLSDAEIAWRLEERRALAMSKGGDAIPKSYRDRPGAILAAWAMGKELGLSPMAALRSIAMISGKPVLTGDLMLAIARAHGVKVEEDIGEPAAVRVEDLGQRIAANGLRDDSELKCTCRAELKDGTVIERSYTQADAEQAGLWGREGPWRQYPRRMLQMRARGFCLRDAIPDLLGGLYVAGELGSPDFIDITPEEEK